jgi:glycosyltransferase involved in cell wall biosynthesis
MTMLCSVIIPTIGRPTLSRAIDSVLQQPLVVDEVEIIIVNDSGKRLDLSCYEHHPKITVVDTNRSGLCFACNAGASIARGDYLKFLHDDDYLLESGLIALLAATGGGRHKWVIGSAVIVDDNGNKIYDLDSSDVKGNILAEFMAGESIHVSYCLFHRQTFLDLGGFNTEELKHSAEDRDLAARFAAKFDVTSISRRVACVRLSGGGSSAYSSVNAAYYYNLARERIFSFPKFHKRLSDSLKGRTSLRGRVCRQIISSSLLNLNQRNVCLTIDRLFWCGYFASGYVFYPAFWTGLVSNRS